MSTDLVSVKGRGLVLQTAEDCKDLIADIEANPTASKIVLGGNSFGVAAIEAVAEKLAHLPITVCSRVCTRTHIRRTLTSVICSQARLVRKSHLL